MTGYHIRIGYISGYSCSLSKLHAFDYLCVAVNEIRTNPAIIKPENSPIPWDARHLEVAEVNYRKDGPALSINDYEVTLCCSGFDEWRGIKEQTAAHTARFLMDYMAKFGVPLTIVVS